MLEGFSYRMEWGIEMILRVGLRVSGVVEIREIRVWGGGE